MEELFPVNWWDYIVNWYCWSHPIWRRNEFEGILVTPEIAGVPIVVLGNKIDIKNAVPEDELKIALGLDVKKIDGTPIEVFMCSVSKRIGHAIGFKWLQKYLKWKI